MTKVSDHGYIGFDTTGTLVGALRIHDAYNNKAFPRPSLDDAMKDRLDAADEVTYSYLQAGTLALINTTTKKIT